MDNNTGEASKNKMQNTEKDVDMSIILKMDVVSNTKIDQEKNHNSTNNGWRKRNIFFGMTIFALFLCCVLAAVYYGFRSAKKEIRHHPLSSFFTSEESNENKNQLAALESPWMDIRLPTWIVPNTYDIDLDVNMDTDIYKGKVIINVFIAHQTNMILFHKVDLDITNIYIRNTKSNNQITIPNEFAYAPNEYYVIQTNSYLKQGEEYNIEIMFNGKMRSDLNGFYTSFYGRNKNKVASTFFSPINARKAFPCFDEPIFKANFTLTLTHSDKYHARSNMQPHTKTSFSRHNNDLLTTKFYPTLKMSTYILCWVISDFKSINNDGFSTPLLNAWTHDDKLEDIRYGLDISQQMLRFYEGYFNISYPMKKLDVVAVPNFAAGAMENWGIITFRSDELLVSKTKATDKDRQKSFFIIAHELVHQWFGNLVTMEFWTDAWLKEGFANNIGIIGGDHVDKTMGSKNQVLTKFMIPALELDSYSTSHPISTTVKTPSDIRSVFDIITYNKGSCLVGLLNQFLGDNDFRSGLQRYLKTYSYRNANQDNLWEQLSLVSGKDVKSVMDTWTLQLGYPVISVRRVNRTYVEITQERFCLDPPNTTPPSSPFGYLWKVPLIFMSPSDKSKISYLLEDKVATLKMPEQYQIVNPDHALYYRVSYGEKMMQSIKTTLFEEPEALTAQDRTGLISDQFSFVAANITTIEKTLDLFLYLKKESDNFPWKTALDQLSYINAMIDSEDMKQMFDSFIRKITKDVAGNVGWGKPTSVNNASLQVLILNQACETDTKAVVKQADKYYRSWILGHGMKVRPSLHPVVRDCAISHGPNYYWDFAFLRYKQRGPGSEMVLSSLASTRNLATIKRVLKYSLNTSIIDSSDAPYLIIEVAQRSIVGRKLSWTFIKQNWDTIAKRYGNDIFMLSDLLSGVLDNFAREEDLYDIKTFFEDKTNIGTGKQALEQAIDKIKANIAWRKNNFEHLSNWLIKQGF